MSGDLTNSYVSPRSLDLNSVAVVHQTELDGSGDAGRFDWDCSAKDGMSAVDPGEDKNVMEVEEFEGGGEGVLRDADFADSNNDLNSKADGPKLEDADESGAKLVQEDTNLVSKELFLNGNGSDEVFKKDGFFGEVEECPKSELGKYVDGKLLEIKEEQKWKSEFSVCDMVWGKVRSHPWWPGLIYDPSFASDMALKHQKKDHFLVAYFGDKTFAWNDKTRLKPFESFFAQMEKQSSLVEFVDAVDEALGEVERRVEFGMTCGCVSDMLIDDLKHKMVVNAGIKESTCCPTLDRCLVASSFDPNRLLDYIYGLAQFPCGELEKLELVKVYAQLKAIYMSKGFSELPEFRNGGWLSHAEEVSAHKGEEGGQDDVEYKRDGFLSNDMSSTEKRRGRGRPRGKMKTIEEDGRRLEYLDEVVSNEISSKAKKSGRGRPPGKKKAIVEDGRKIEYNDDGILLNDTSAKEKRRGRGRPPGTEKTIEEDGRKQKSLHELMEQTADHAASISSSKKRMISDLDSVGFGQGKTKRLKSLVDLGSISDSSTVLKVGQRISRVANKMKVSSTEHNDLKLYKGNSKSPRRETALKLDYPAPSEMLSQLCFAAKGPTKAHRFQPIVSDFFLNWRDSHVGDSLDDDKLQNLVDSKRGRKELADSELVPVEVKSDYLQDSYWSDVMFEENPKKEDPSRSRKRKANSKINQSKKPKAAGISFVSSTLEPPTLNTIEHASDGSAILSHRQQQEERVVNLSDDTTMEESNPAALILSFSDPDGLPSKSDLIIIFSKFGPLKEAETEVSKKNKRASVMFKRGADAEVAFSSSGKFSAFGPKLVSYRLRYSTSSSPATTPQKDPSPPKAGTSVVAEDSVVLVSTD